jgi:hypothetical protein
MKPILKFKDFVNESATIKEGYSEKEKAYIDAERAFDDLFNKIQDAKFGWGTKTRKDIDKIADQLLALKKKYTSVKLDD